MCVFVVCIDHAIPLANEKTPASVRLQTRLCVRVFNHNQGIYVGISGRLMTENASKVHDLRPRQSLWGPLTREPWMKPVLCLVMLRCYSLLVPPDAAVNPRLVAEEHG